MALNKESDNSVTRGPGGSKVPADGTGKILRSIGLGMSGLTCLGVVRLDPWLSPFKDALRSRYNHAQKWIKTIDEAEGGLEKFSRGFEKFGFNVHENGDIIYREWAPNVTKAYLIGDFSICTYHTPL